MKGRTSIHGISALTLLVGLVSSPVVTPAVAQQTRLAVDCALCHGSLEFLRQHSSDLATARRRLVTMDDIRASAHADSSCASCHAGFDRWPHPQEATSRTCGSCHESEEGTWQAGVHAVPDTPALETVECTQCHTEHHAAPTDSLRSGEAMLAMNATCLGCHETSPLPPGDPHRNEVPCAACHRPHDTHDVDEVSAAVAPLAQAETCGACHEEQAAAARLDVHGTALRDHEPLGLATLELLGGSAAPACTTCHGSHGMSRIEEDLALDEPEVCGHCHEHALETFDDSYHGQASALGSIAVATCSDCHGSHGIYGEDHPESTVHPDRLVESCGTCHEASRAGFVLYQPHADHNDRENYPGVYWTYRLMTALLVGVFAVFGIHSVLWIVRLTVDNVRRSSGGEA